MSVKRRALIAGGAGLLAGTMTASVSYADEGFQPFEGLEDFWTATDAYIYGYPLVTMEMTRRIMTNVATAGGTVALWVRL